MHHAPPAASPLAPTDLARLLHFVNLHGATADTRWLGDPGFAVVLDVDDVAAHVAAGTVAVSEACFGGELFDPALTGGAPPFPVAYLGAGAYAVVGATSISYGGRLAPDAADVLCRYVVEELLTGASLGRAVLQARQRYVRDQPVMTPVDLKTLAQFTLFGDPSIHPVTAPATGTRAMRRRSLAAAGPSIARSSAVAAGAGMRAGRARVRRHGGRRGGGATAGAAHPRTHPPAARAASPGSRRGHRARRGRHRPAPVPRPREQGRVDAVTEPVRVRGTVRRDVYAPGSKSEHVAVLLDADDGRTWVLRRPGANPYDDPELAELDGATVDVEGRTHRDVLLVEGCSLVTGSPPPRPDAPGGPPPSSRRRSPRPPRSAP